MTGEKAMGDGLPQDLDNNFSPLVRGILSVLVALIVFLLGAIWYFASKYIDKIDANEKASGKNATDIALISERANNLQGAVSTIRGSLPRLYQVSADSILSEDVHRAAIASKPFLENGVWYAGFLIYDKEPRKTVTFRAALESETDVTPYLTFSGLNASIEPRLRSLIEAYGLSDSSSSSLGGRGFVEESYSFFSVERPDTVYVDYVGTIQNHLGLGVSRPADDQMTLSNVISLARERITILADTVEDTDST